MKANAKSRLTHNERVQLLIRSITLFEHKTGYAMARFVYNLFETGSIRNAAITTLTEDSTYIKIFIEIFKKLYDYIDK